MQYTIREASEMFHLPATTLRYYDKQGLLPFMERKASGYRIFSENDIAMLRVIECLKRSGMSIREIRRFTDLTQKGDASLAERHQLFLERKQAVEEQLKEMQEMLDFINHKCWYYETALAAGTESIHKKDCG